MGHTHRHTRIVAAEAIAHDIARRIQAGDGLSLLTENGERIFLFDVGLDNAPLWKSICPGYNLPFFPTDIMTTAGDCRP